MNKMSMHIRIIACCIFSLLAVSTVYSKTFIVYSSGDESDYTPDDFVCSVSSTPDSMNCTLRAAIDEANFSSGPDTILFANGLGPILLINGPLILTDNATIILGQGNLPQIDAVGNPHGSNTFEINSDYNRISGLKIERSRRNAIYIKKAFNLIGGDSPTERMVLVGNGLDDDNAAAVMITSDSARFNTVKGNFIGIEGNGTIIRGNSNGIIIEESASDNNVGGIYLQNGNLISGNNGWGLIISSGATRNTVSGALIGPDITGEVAAPNDSGAVLISYGAHDNQIGGTVISERNLISGNNGNGLEIRGIGTIGNRILGNHIGPALSGRVALANQGVGVQISEEASDNFIGVVGLNSGNLISGNRRDGILLIGSGVRGNIIANNLIGSEPRGLGYLPNGTDSGHGLSIIDGPQNNIIGGTTLAEGNLISGNLNHGIFISGPTTSNNIISANFVGVNIRGSSSLLNGSGIVIRGGANNNRIGGEIEGERNIISGNRGDIFPFGGGVIIYDNGSSNNVIIGNYIGTDYTGTRALRNGSAGVIIGNGASNNRIGGDRPELRNLISGNGSDIAVPSRAGGVHLEGDGTVGNIIAGNYIGVSATGDVSLANRGHGVGLFNGASENIIGGDNPEDGNIIAYSNGHGILVTSIFCTRNLIRHNFMHDNDSLGIAIRNEAQDNISPPLLEQASTDSIKGSSAPPLGRVDIYLATGNNSGRGEGGEFIASADVGPNGKFSTSIGVSVMDSLTAIATDPDGNSSEFSANIVAGTIVSVDNDNLSSLPNSVQLSQNYPNPFNPSTTIEYELPRSSIITLTIYNLLGREVILLENSLKNAGRHEVHWDGKNSSGLVVSSGLYFYRLKGNSFELTRKMNLLK